MNVILNQIVSTVLGGIITILVIYFYGNKPVKVVLILGGLTLILVLALVVIHLKL